MIRLSIAIILVLSSFGLPVKKKIIYLQPFSDFPMQLIAPVKQELANMYGADVLVLPAKSIYKEAYYKPRNRYRADKLLHCLKRDKPANGFTVMGLATYDISCTKNEIYDWGVMGLGTQSPGACVISTYRLNKKKLKDQTIKLALHEMGHNHGLPHCPDKTCIMADAEGKNNFDNETVLCRKCRSRFKKN